jgi:hypothetical protein
MLAVLVSEIKRRTNNSKSSKMFSIKKACKIICFRNKQKQKLPKVENQLIFKAFFRSACQMFPFSSFLFVIFTAEEEEENDLKI